MVPWGRYRCMYRESESCSVVSDSLWPGGLYSPWNSPGQNTTMGSLSLLPGQSSQHRDQTQVSCIVGGFFNSWATGKSKDTGVGSLSLLQQIFPTQELNRGLLHCRQIPYQLREAVSTVLCFKRQLHKHVYSHNLWFKHHLFIDSKGHRRQFKGKLN